MEDQSYASVCGLHEGKYYRKYVWTSSFNHPDCWEVLTKPFGVLTNKRSHTIFVFIYEHLYKLYKCTIQFEYISTLIQVFMKWFHSESMKIYCCWYVYLSRCSITVCLTSCFTQYLPKSYLWVHYRVLIFNVIYDSGLQSRSLQQKNMQSLSLTLLFPCASQQRACSSEVMHISFLGFEWQTGKFSPPLVPQAPESYKNRNSNRFL